MARPSKTASVWCALLIALGVVIVTAPARADSAFDGKWTQGPLREDFTIQQWLSGCGPSPASGQSGGGESIQIRQEGDELSFVGGGRVFRTNQCYDQMPNLIRSTHQRDASGRSWRTNCTTPAGDPRSTLLQTLVAATSDTHIEVTETGRYEIVLAEGRCIADIKRARGYDLVQKDGVPAPSATVSAAPAPTTPPPPVPEKTAAPRVDCASPGDPARLEVRPSRKLLRTGESFAFRGIVVDANGCATSQAVTFALASQDDASKIALEPSGKVSVPQAASLGSADIIASAAGKTTHVTVEVTSPSQYDELLARSGLNAKGENENAAITIIATQSIGGGEGRAEDTSTRRRIIFGSAVGGLALALAAVWLVMHRRSKRAKQIESELEERHAERIRLAEERRTAQKAKYESELRAHQQSLEAAEAHAKATAAAAAASAVPAAPNRDTLVCSTCKRDYPPGSLFCPHDGNKLHPLGEGQSASTGAICPACKRGFDPGKKTCPFDGEELIPYAAHAAAAARDRPPQQAKICPTCGGRFEGTATFCGKDGTALVLLN